MDNVKVRVVNKNKDGVIVKSLDGNLEQSFNWSDFEKYFIATDEEFIYEIAMSEEENLEVEKIMKRQDWLTQYFPMLLMVMRKQELGTASFGELSYVGCIVKEYCETFPDCTQMDLVDDYRLMKRTLEARFGV